MVVCLTTAFLSRVMLSALEQFSCVVSIYWYQGGGISHTVHCSITFVCCVNHWQLEVPCWVPSRLNDTSSPWAAFFIFLRSQKKQFNSWSSILIHFWQAFPWMLFKDTCGFLQPINHSVWWGISMIFVKPYKNVHEHNTTLCDFAMNLDLGPIIFGDFSIIYDILELLPFMIILEYDRNLSRKVVFPYPLFASQAFTYNLSKHKLQYLFEANFWGHWFMV